MPFGGTGGWPEVDDLKRRLDVNDASVHDDEMAVILAAGIAQIKLEVGDWDDASDTANDALAEAALDRGVELASDAPIPRDERKSLQLLKGERRRFSIG
jgi:hypothetical protein